MCVLKNVSTPNGIFSAYREEWVTALVNVLFQANKIANAKDCEGHSVCMLNRRSVRARANQVNERTSTLPWVFAIMLGIGSMSSGMLLWQRNSASCPVLALFIRKDIA
jgi:hypothetical protein